MNEDKDYTISISDQLNNFTYPVQNFRSSINSTASTFMVGMDDFWHNGFHLYSANEIKNICDGKVIAYRLTKDYKMYEIFKNVSMNNFVAAYYHITDDVKFMKYFDKDDQNQYVIKSDLSKEDKEDLYKLFDRIYSNNFILLEYTLKNLSDKEIKFYGLYNHLKPLQRLTVKQKMQLDWYKKTIKINSYPKYFYIQAYKTLSKDGLKDSSPELEIPSETAYSELPVKCVQWTCNQITYQGYLDNSYIISWEWNKNEIKSVNDSTKDYRYLKSSDPNVKHEEDHILVYNVKTRSNRNTIAEISSDKDYRIGMTIFDFNNFLKKNSKELNQNKIEGLPIYITDSQVGYVYLSKEEILNIKKNIDNYIKEHKNYQELAGFLLFNGKNGIKFGYNCIVNTNFSASKNTNYVKVIGVKKIIGSSEVSYKDIDYIPCETEVTLVKEQKYLYIEWIINNNSYKGYVESKDLRIPNKTYKLCETKRPNNIFEETNSDNFLPRDSKSKKDKLIIYTTGSKANRNVKGFTYEKELIIENFNSFLELFYDKGKERNINDIYNTGVKVLYNNSKDVGYIYFDWDYNVKNSNINEEREKNKVTVLKNITDVRNSFKNWLIKVEDEGKFTNSNFFELRYELSKDIELDKIVTPDNCTFKRDKILGYAGYSFFKESKDTQNNIKEVDNEDATSVHFEIFTDNLSFMAFPSGCKKYQCSLLVKKECIIQKGNLIPVTHNKKIDIEKNFDDKSKAAFRKQFLQTFFKPSFIPDEIGYDIKNCLFKKVKNVVVSNETFTELKPIARLKSLESNCFFLRSDLGEWLDNAYYGVKEDKTIPAYDVNGNKEDFSVELFAGYYYLWADTKANLRRLKFIYEKITGVDSFFVSSRTLGKLSPIKECCYVYDNDNTRIFAEEILQEPKEQKWTDIQDRISEGVLEYKNIQCTDDNKTIWENVKLQSGLECWIKQSDISEDDDTPIKKIIYDKWDKFFTQIQLSKYGKYFCNKKEDFLNEFGLELGKSKRVSSVIKNKKELLYSKYYKRETEWLKSDEYTNELIKHYPMNKDAIMQERTDYEFWSGLNGKLSNECYYFNPLGFLNHMDKVATKPEYNPYEDLHYSDVYYKKNSFVANIDLSTKIKDNPGFAPYSGDYAMISGFFNEDYAKYDNLSYKNTYTHFYHEGIDFSAIVDTPIKSLINAKVIAFGLQKNGSGQYSTYGRCVWLQNINGPGIYLLAHLSKFCDNISVGMTVKVGEVIAYTGRSGAKDGKFVEECWAPHLHLSYFNYTYDKHQSYFYMVDGIINYNNDYKFILDKLANPFNHNGEKRLPEVLK